VYTLRLDDATRGHVTTYAQPVGWRFILTNEAEALAAVEVSERGESDFVFSQVNYGRFVDSTVEGVRRFEAANEGPHELRLLDIPALYLLALWLHGDKDRFMPLHPAPRAFDPYRMYSDEEFSRRVAELAATRGEGPALAPP
jgi:hypothetical protein